MQCQNAPWQPYPLSSASGPSGVCMTLRSTAGLQISMVWQCVSGCTARYCETRVSSVTLQAFKHAFLSDYRSLKACYRPVQRPPRRCKALPLLEPQMQSLNASLSSCLDGLGCISIFNQFLPGILDEDVMIEGRQFRIVRLLGEGGYSFVYLVREIQTEEHSAVGDTHYALKKILAGSNEQLIAAQKEVEVMTQLQHPNLLPLLTHTTLETYNNGSLLQLVYMLFPVYEEGTLLDEVTRRQQQDPLTPAEILHIFLQICCGVQAMHACKPPLAHRDIKPHNVLLQRHPHSQRDCNQPPPGANQEAQPLHAVGDAPAGSSYHAVLMDFGSCQPARFKVLNRSQALAVQEDAEAHCTAPYKAPELFDVPSECDLDERVDVWSLGCLLYYMMYGVSPFERMLNEAGGSLALAVINNRPTWPDMQKQWEPMQQLVSFCLNSDPQKRPFIDDVVSKVRGIQE